MDSSKTAPESSLAASIDQGGEGFRAVHLLVVGLSGAGKSTFIQKVTGSPNVVIGSGIRGVTPDVQEYITYHKGVEVHLIDTPGFDDCRLTDHVVLMKISDWVNTVYSQGWKIGGIIYIYDVTRSRLGGAGEQNIRLLEEFTGRGRWHHISLVTNKWGWTRSPENEANCEKELESDEKAWKFLREGSRPARLHRFYNDQKSGLEIVSWHLDQSFEPEITYQMADPSGPRLSMGETDAGQIIQSSYMPKLMQLGDSSARAQLDQAMGHRFDDQQVQFAIRGILERLHRAKVEHRIQQVGRWAIRLSMVGGCIMATLVTENPSALGAAVAAGRRIEARLQRQRTMKKEEIAEIERAIAGMM